MGSSLASPTHLIFLAIACLLLFGAKRLPEIGRSLGSGLREFKTTVSGMDGVPGLGGDAHETGNATPAELTDARGATGGISAAGE